MLVFIDEAGLKFGQNKYRPLPLKEDAPDERDYLGRYQFQVNISIFYTNCQ